MSQSSVDLSHKIRGGEINKEGKLAFPTPSLASTNVEKPLALTNIKKQSIYLEINLNTSYAISTERME